MGCLKKTLNFKNHRLKNCKWLNKKIAINIINDENKPGIVPKTISIENVLISYIKLFPCLEIVIGTKEIFITV